MTKAGILAPNAIIFNFQLHKQVSVFKIPSLSLILPKLGLIMAKICHLKCQKNALNCEEKKQTFTFVTVLNKKDFLENYTLFNLEIVCQW